jgi:hypothetical protein
LKTWASVPTSIRLGSFQPDRLAVEFRGRIDRDAQVRQHGRHDVRVRHLFIQLRLLRSPTVDDQEPGPGFRPRDLRAVLPYLAMSYLYKRSNRLWHWLIRRRLTAAVWRILVEVTHRRHLVFRQRLTEEAELAGSGCVVSAGV